MPYLYRRSNSPVSAPSPRSSPGSIRLRLPATPGMPRTQPEHGLQRRSHQHEDQSDCPLISSHSIRLFSLVLTPIYPSIYPFTVHPSVRASTFYLPSYLLLLLSFSLFSCIDAVKSLSRDSADS